MVVAKVINYDVKDRVFLLGDMHKYVMNKEETKLVRIDTKEEFEILTLLKNHNYINAEESYIMVRFVKVKLLDQIFKTLHERLDISDPPENILMEIDFLIREFSLTGSEAMYYLDRYMKSRLNN